MGVPEINAAAPEAKTSNSGTAVIKVQNEDELRLAQMGGFSELLCLPFYHVVTESSPF